MTAAVLEAQAHYVLALKGNRGALPNHVKKHFKEAELAGYPDAPSFESRDDAHGRLEYRIVRTLPLGQLPGSIKAPWTGLQTIVQIDRVRATDELTVHRAYYVTSHGADPKPLADRIRAHWSIENQLHHCLDVSFADDRRSIRSKNGSQNFALINRYALNVAKARPDEDERRHETT